MNRNRSKVETIFKMLSEVEVYLSQGKSIKPGAFCVRVS